ncbi:MAG: hypothetical protein ACI85I_000329 [Arenicella sp.]|jgi:hypothetical protein
MKYLLFAILFAFNFELTAHDLSMASFKFHTEANEQLYLVIQEDFKLAFSNNGICNYESETMRNKLIEEYLKSHLGVYLNDTFREFTIINISEDEHRFYIKIKFDKAAQEIVRIRLENTFLISTMEKQINMIELHLNDRVRGFKMNKNRVEIFADY